MVWFIPLLTAAAQALMSKSAANKAQKGQAKAQAASDVIENEKLRLSREAEARADEQYARYQRTFVPLQDELIRNATRPINPDVDAGLAGADVEAQMATARGSLDRQIGRRGINPADGAVVDAESRLALAGGKARAAAMTSARRNAVADRNTRIAGAVGLGTSLPGMAYNYGAQANAGLASVGANRSNTLLNQNALAGAAGSELGLSFADLMRGGFNSYDNYQQQQLYNKIGLVPISTTARRIPVAG